MTRKTSPTEEDIGTCRERVRFGAGRGGGGGWGGVGMREGRRALMLWLRCGSTLELKNMMFKSTWGRSSG
jgi:hypothetical protein